MIRIVLALTAWLIVFLTLPAQFAIGEWTVDVTDPARGGRTIPCEVFYPATTSGSMAPAASGTFPVIAFGHGFSMNYDAYSNFWNEFVPQGYILIFPKTEVGPIPFPDHADFALDLIRSVTFLREQGADASSFLFGAVDSTAAVMGHSMGGGCSFLAAEQFAFDGVVGFAPAETDPEASVAAVNVVEEALIFSGEDDGVTPPADHHILIYDALASTCKTLLSIPGAGHCRFAESNIACDFGELTSGGPGSVSRADLHDLTFDFLTPWLQWRLKKECHAWDVFQDSVAVSPRVNSQQSCFYDRAVPEALWDNLPAGPICEGDSFTFSAVDSNYLFTWFENGVDVNNSAPTWSSSSAGSYQFVVTNTVGCSDTSTVENLVNQLFEVTLSPADSVFFCQGDEAFVEASATIPATFTWLFNGDTLPVSTASFLIDTPGSYQAVGQSSIGCVDTSSVLQAVEIARLVIDSLLVPDSVAIGDTALCRLTATPAFDTIVWSVSGGTIVDRLNDSLWIRRNSPGLVLVQAEAFLGGCSALDNASFVFVAAAEDTTEPTSLTRNNALEGVVFNTATKRLTVREGLFLRMYSISGQQVAAFTGGNYSLTEYPSGIYFLSDGLRAMRLVCGN